MKWFTLLLLAIFILFMILVHSGIISNNEVSHTNRENNEIDE